MYTLARFLNLLTLFYRNEFIIILTLDTLGTATKIAFTSGRGVKFESLQKNTSPASEKMNGSSTRLLNNPVTPRDIDFCDGEESMSIGVDEEQVDPSEVKKIDENIMTVDSGIEKFFEVDPSEVKEFFVVDNL